MTDQKFVIIDFSGITYAAAGAGKKDEDAFDYVMARIQGTCSKLGTRRIAICMDGKPPQWRNRIYPEYKMQREKDPSLAEIRQRVRELSGPMESLVRNLGHIVLKVDGVEADDLAGLAAYRLNYWHPTISLSILTADHDYYSLLGLAEIIHPQRGTSIAERTVTLEDFRMEYGIEPWLWPHVKTLQGDTSDNWPGLKGIGEKKALQAIKDGVRADTPQESWPDAYRAGKWQQEPILNLPDALRLMTIPIHENQLPEEIRQPVAEELQKLTRIMGPITPPGEERLSALDVMGSMSFLYRNSKPYATCWLP
jgi:5'-3' exonuclease